MSRLTAAVFVAVMLLGACSNSDNESVDESPTSAPDVADVVGDPGVALPVVEVLGREIASVGLAVDTGSFSCDGGGDLSVGASLDCSFTSNGQPVGLVAEVVSMEGSNIGFEVRTQAKAVPSSVLAGAVQARTGQQLGAAIDAATCADDLAPDLGASTTCTLTNGEQTREATVTVSAIDGGRIDYTIDPA